MCVYRLMHLHCSWWFAMGETRSIYTLNWLHGFFLPHKKPQLVSLNERCAEMKHMMWCVNYCNAWKHRCMRCSRICLRNVCTQTTRGPHSGPHCHLWTEDTTHYVISKHCSSQHRKAAIWTSTITVTDIELPRKICGQLYWCCLKWKTVHHPL